MDALAYFGGPSADLAFRRGWTHGIPALVVLPFVLTGGVLLLDQAARRLRRAAIPSAVVPREVLLLATVAILTHPLLDTLNTYGVRWLMPFSGRWFYGDTLFIADPWLWLVLGAAALTRSPRRARLALAVASAYVVGMLGSGLVARRIVRQELEAGGTAVTCLMVAPQPVTPLTRRIVAVQGDAYRIGAFRWLGRPHVDRASLRTVRRPGPDDPALAAARTAEAGRRFLGWARFPAVEVEADPAGGSIVQLIDLRYADRPGAGFGSMSVPVARSPGALMGPPAP